MTRTHNDRLTWGGSDTRPYLGGFTPPPAPRRWMARDDEVGKVLSFLLPDRAARRSGRVSVLSGPLGIGKTAIAARIATLTRSLYAGGVVWIDCVGAPDRDVGRYVRRALGDALSLGTCDADDPASRRAFKHRLRQHDVLLVLDGVASDGVVDTFSGEEDAVDCIVTTRYRHVASALSRDVIEVGPLPRRAAREMLECLVERPRLTADEAGTADLLTVMGGVPRSIVAAASILQRHGLTSPRMLVDLLQRAAVALGDERAGGDALALLEHVSSAVMVRAELPRAAWQLFLRLAPFGAARFPTLVAALMSALDETPARRLLNELVDHHLLRVTRSPGPEVADTWLALEAHAHWLAGAILGQPPAAVAHDV